MFGQLWVAPPGVGAGVAGVALPLEPLPEEFDELDDELEEAAWLTTNPPAAPPTAMPIAAAVNAARRLRPATGRGGGAAG
jgi:hypothetical protein